MMKMTLVSLLMLSVAATAEPSTTPSTSVGIPARFQGVWGKNGRCDRAADRLTITATSAGWGNGPFKPVLYDADDQKVMWTDKYDVSNFEMGGRPNMLVYNAEGNGMPAAVQGYLRCSRSMKRLAWPRPLI